MDTYSGMWNFKVGLPAKSGFSGVTIVVVPNLMGFAIWSPPLDENYNSKKGELFAERFIHQQNYKNIMYKQVKETPDEMEKKIKNQGMNLIFYAAANNLRGIRRLVGRGTDLNYRDYDSRTALQLAAVEGHTDVVKYLVAHGARKDIKDLHGRTAYDDAVRSGHAETAEALK